MRVLVAIAGLTHSQLVLNMAAQLGPLTAELLTLMTVVSHAGDCAEAGWVLDRASELLSREVAGVHTLIRVGQPADEIVREANARAYDLVIVGDQHPFRRSSRLIVGSTTAQVVDRSPCPVLVAKGAIRPMRHILVCDSGAQNPSVLGCFTQRTSALLRAESAVTLLHVLGQCSEDRYDADLMAATDDPLEEDTPEADIFNRGVQMLAQFGIRPHTKLRHGRVADEIVAEANTQDYQLVVIGAQCGDFWRHSLLNDLAHRIIARVECPVLVACSSRV